MVLATTQFDVVGTRPLRHDGTDKVTGRALYGADFTAAGLIHGAVLRSPHAHALIRSIDTSKAEAVPGVLAVVTAEDFPGVDSSPDGIVDLGESAINLGHLRDNVLASKKALYKGQPIAAVAAANAHEAREALGLIEVDYEVLPAVVTVQEAMRDDAPILHDHMRTLELGEQTDRVSNVSEHTQYVLGDLDKGLAEADVVIEREYDTAMVHQGYIEPQNATAFWNKDGKVTIWSSTQGPFQIRDATATLLDLDAGDVRLVPMEIGGGFGGKLDPFGAPVAAMLSKKTGRPVKVVMGPGRRPAEHRPNPGQQHEGEGRSYQGGKDHGSLRVPCLRGGRVSGVSGHRRRLVGVLGLRHSQSGNRRLRRGPEQTEDRRLQGTGRHPCRLRHGGRCRRARREAGDRSHRAAPHERGQRGHAAAVRTNQSADRLRRGTGGNAGPSSLLGSDRRR